MPKFRQMPTLRRLVSELTRSHCRSSRLARGLRLQRAMQTKPSIVFVHGIWADGSSFSKVIPTLRAEGHEVIAAQYGLDTLAGDVAAVKRTLGRGSSPAILVGHADGVDAIQEAARSHTAG